MAGERRSRQRKKVADDKILYPNTQNDKTKILQMPPQKTIENTIDKLLLLRLLL
jgi:hypothetical protein